MEALRPGRAEELNYERRVQSSLIKQIRKTREEIFIKLFDNHMMFILKATKLSALNALILHDVFLL